VLNRGLVVSMLTSSTQVRGFKPGRSRRIFRATKSSACLPSEGKYSRLSHVAALRHVKELSNYMAVGLSSYISSAISRRKLLLSHTVVCHAVWHGAPLEMNGETKAELKVQTASKAEVH
jgi:hypothetical protein